MYNHTVLFFIWLILTSFPRHFFIACVMLQRNTWNYSQRQKTSLSQDMKLQKTLWYTNGRNSIFHSRNSTHTNAVPDTQNTRLFSHLPGGSKSQGCPKNAICVCAGRAEQFVLGSAGACAQRALCWLGRKGEAAAEGDSAGDVTLSHPLDEPPLFPAAESTPWSTGWELWSSSRCRWQRCCGWSSQPAPGCPHHCLAGGTCPACPQSQPWSVLTAGRGTWCSGLGDWAQITLKILEGFSSLKHSLFLSGRWKMKVFHSGQPFGLG